MMGLRTVGAWVMSNVRPDPIFHGWAYLNLKNGTPAFDALFGGGTAIDEGLISKVIVGGKGTMNDYPNMHKVLSKLGIKFGTSTGTALAHENHFHIYLRPPKAVSIVAAQNLLAGYAIPYQTATVASDAVQLVAQALLAQAKKEMNLNEGDIVMAIADVPNIPPQYASVMIAQASQAQKSTANIDRTLGVCQMVSNPSTLSDRSGNTLSPVLIASSYFNSFEHKVLAGSSKVTVLINPTHGTLEDLGTLAVDQYGKVIRDTGETEYYYKGQAGYVGQDSTTLLVEMTGYKVKVIYFFHVFDEVIYDDVPYTEELCPNGEYLWKISTLPAPGTVVKDGTIQSWLAATDFSSLLAAPSGVSFNIAGLTGGALGQTTGTSITLDDNAAGTGWFIDTTPADNSEFLPTSNPYEWVAKEGTAAYGKMDMLSVLLHEYGHALGIEHSTDAHDYMGTTLTAGVRRLPSADELALMQQLVAGIQTASVSTQGSSNNAPSQLPLLPLGGFGLAFLGRLRSSRYGSINLEADLNTLQVNYEALANAQFTNGSFVSTNGMPPDNGWTKQGQVDFANGTATLQEVTTSQTRLNQVFMVKPTDRYLSFTLSGSALEDMNGAPDDAFEVALLDANTGASLLGSDGLSRSDAFLNLQADGTEALASQVTKVVNADGSYTYRVDLSALSNALKASGSAGQAVNLSFDLIGFGKANSHINVSDVRVSGLPELHDVTAAMNEDGALDFDPFAQVDNAALLQLGSHVVDQPAHGTVTVNADGTFVYIPAANYFGDDTFTYRLNDGPLESNLATVNVTVTAVNDAPVAADVYATATEDTPLVINLGQAQGLAPTGYVTDVDSTNVTTQIVTGPAHGVLVANADGTYTYTPDANYNGLDNFTYKANDGQLDSNVATFNLSVTPVNDAPSGTSNTVTTLEDTPYVFHLADFGFSDTNDLVKEQASRLQGDGFIDVNTHRPVLLLS